LDWQGKGHLLIILTSLQQYVLIYSIDQDDLTS
jgi:hypothetical protein